MIMQESLDYFIEKELPKDVLIIMCGLPATVKTGIAEKVSKMKGYPILSTDMIRREILDDVNIFDENIAGSYEIRKRVYIEMFQRAKKILKKESGVILDATFVTQELRRQAAKIAYIYNNFFVILQTVCSKEASINRILERDEEDYESNALTEAAYMNNVKIFEEVNLGDLRSIYPSLKIIHVIINTELDNDFEWYITKKEYML